MAIRNGLVKWSNRLLERELEQGDVLKKYECVSCKCQYGSVQKFTKHIEFKTCPKCYGELESLITGPAMVLIKGEPKTIGQLAEQNTKKLGRYEKQERDRKQAESETTARKAIKAPDKDKAEKIRKINKMTPKQVEKYINTGKGV